MRGAGVAPDGGTIRLLTMPRMLGFAFNPLSVYFCFRRAGALAAMLYEVDNTFGERHGYLIAVEGEGEIVQHCAKIVLRLAVHGHGPALPLPPARAGRSGSASSSTPPTATGLVLTARFHARREPLTDANLLRQLFATPLLPLRVIGGIHWEALKLWRKGIGLRRRPAPPAAPVDLHARRPGSEMTDACRCLR